MSELVDTISAWLRDAQALRNDLMRRREAVDVLPDIREFAQQVAALPTCTIADTAAAAVAQAGSYILPKVGSDVIQAQRAGRRLTPDTLVRTGVAGLMLAEPDAD